MMCLTAQVPLFNGAEIMRTCNIPLDVDPTPRRSGLFLGPDCVNVNPQAKVRLTKLELCLDHSSPYKNQWQNSKT